MNPPKNLNHAWIVLNAIPNIGPVNVRRLLDAFRQDPLSILSASESSLLQVKGIGKKAASAILQWRNYFDLERELSRMVEANASFVSCDQPNYPEVLKTIYDPPIGFYQKGPFLFADKQPAIAIVGSRNTTLYGLRVARSFAQRLASMGFCIVSGMARGVDTAAHEGALEASGDTVAVLGNGLDIIYPPENLDLYRRIEAKGAVISEFCFGRRADRQTFPMRNRIVSGLCDGVLVVESDRSGGSMITAKFAAEQNRQVYAIPGRIDQSTSRGCHQLIKEGAILTTSVDDILDDLKYRIQQPELDFRIESERDEKVDKVGGSAPRLNSDTKTDSGFSQLDGPLRELYSLISSEGVLSVDQILDLTDMDVSRVNARLMELELKKLIVKQMDGSFTTRN